LKDAVCVFYLVLRALDTIEDDMSISMETKEPLLLNFYRHSQDETFSMEGIGDNRDYMALLKNYPIINKTFKELNEGSRETIIDITRQMGAGMVEFARKDVKTIEDFDLYCHYVAGLVGIGLTRLFLNFNRASVILSDSGRISNSMGLFLQKTNIIRDYHEDLFSDRSFWPEEIWGAHVKNLEDLAKNPKAENSLACLNHMVADALRHVPDCIEYLSSVQDEKIFRFTAVPQIMAIATLAKLFNNPNHSRGNHFSLLQILPFQHIKSNWKFTIGWININNIITTMFWNKAQNRFRQITMRVNNSNPFSRCNIRKNHIFQEC
jgi:farnesyl-diphosphate farnesyltransferase